MDFTPKDMIKFKNSRTAIEIPSLDKKIIQTSLSRAQIRKLPVHDHMTHDAKIDIVTCHDEISNLHFILKIIFRCLFIEKLSIFSNLVQLIMKV